MAHKPQEPAHRGQQTQHRTIETPKGASEVHRPAKPSITRRAQAAQDRRASVTRSGTSTGSQASTSWEPIATWYKRWVGPQGSEYHQKLAIPAAMELLDLKPGETLLDIGCGNGVLARHVPPAIRYIGVDASPRLIAYARSVHRAAGLFLQGDARRLESVPGLAPGIADAAVFLLSIQDMGPLDQVLESAGWAVHERGRIVILMFHPCFRVPRQSGWGWDQKRKLQYRRVDSYLSPMVVPVRPVAKGRAEAIRSFHQPIQAYVNGLAARGFRVDRLVEIPSYPGIQRTGPNAKAENRASSEIPVFLGLRAARGP